MLIQSSIPNHQIVNPFMRLLFLILLVFNSSCFAQADWVLAKDKDGIKVFLRNYKNGRLKEFKATTTCKATLPQLLSVFQDVENSKSWMADIKKSTLLKSISGSDCYKYFEISVPFPLKNRDVIYHEKIKQEHNKAVHIILKSVSDYSEDKHGLVRMTESEGLWTFQPKGGGDIEITYQLYADPEGIPSWVVNLLMVDGPLLTLKNLKEEVKKDAYQHKKFAFIKE